MTIKLQLRSVPVFQFLSQEQVIKLGSIAKAIEKRRSEAFLLHGETVPGIYIVGSGKVGVYPPGTVRPLVQLGVGESFGEMSFLEKSKASATIRAEEDGTKVAVLLQADLTQICEEDPELGQALYHGMAVNLSSKLRTTTAKIAAELQVGRKLLMDLARDDQTAVNLTGLAAEVVRHNENVVNQLDASAKIVENFTHKMPEKTGAFGELAFKLSEVKRQCMDFNPRLANQIAAITAFIKSMEDFILQSTRD